MSVWLNYHHLYYFRTIANEGSISKAAKKLRLGQPTLSTQLKQLEDHLDVQLFDREHKKLTLTESGKVALDYANEIFRLGSEMLEVLADRQGPTRMHVQFGALDSVPKNLIGTLVSTALGTAKCSVAVLEGGDEELMRELMAHRIDLMLTNRLPDSSRGAALIARSIARFPVVVCGHPKFKALAGGFPASLNGQPFVLPTPHSWLRTELDHFFKTKGIMVDCVAETQDTSVQKILGGRGIGLVPIARPAVSQLLKKGDLAELGELKGVSEQIYLVAAKRRIENPVASAVMKNFALGRK